MYSGGLSMEILMGFIQKAIILLIGIIIPQTLATPRKK